MIMGGDSKKIAALIVSRANPQHDMDKMKAANAENFKSMAAEDDPEEYTGLHAAAEDILKAIKANDVKMLVEAMITFDEIHDSHEEGESSEEEAAEHPILG